MTFFAFRSRLVSSTVQAHTVGLKDDGGEYAENRLIKGEYSGIDFPVIFKQECGEKFTDILDTGWPSLYLISKSLKRTLEENNLTGWKTYPIKLLDKKNNEIEGYYGFSIVGRSARHEYNQSQVIEKRRVEHGPVCKFYKGVIIHDWDGHDFFMPRDSFFILIAKRVAELLKTHKITNLELECLDDYLISAGDVDRRG